jgi:repressor of nif and glnA expression
MNEELKELLRLLEHATRPLTARRIADKLKTYPATALRRVEALRVELRKDNRNRQVKHTTLREGRRGPPSTGWYLV